MACEGVPEIMERKVFNTCPSQSGIEGPGDIRECLLRISIEEHVSQIKPSDNACQVGPQGFIDRNFTPVTILRFV